MKKSFLSFFCIVFACLFLANSFSVSAQSNAEIINNTFVFLEKDYDNQNLFESDFALSAGNTSNDWIAFVGGISGKQGENYKKQIFSKLNTEKPKQITDIYRMILTYSALGGNKESLKENGLISESIFYYEDIGKQGANGYIWALITLDSKNYDIPENALNNRESLIKNILSFRKNNGGFSFNGKTDVDITAMALTALAPYKDSNEIYSFTNADGNSDSYTIGEIIDSSLNWLSSVQKDDGDFASWGVDNCESTAQVIIALCSLGIDPKNEKLFTKSKNITDGLMKYYIEGQGFSHILSTEGVKINNGIATGQGLCALKAMELLDHGKKLFDLSYIKGKPDLFENENSETNVDMHSTIDENTETENDRTDTNYKAVVIISLAVTGIFLAVISYLKTKKFISSIAFLIVFGIFIGFMAISKFESVEEHYSTLSEEAFKNSPKITLTVKCDSALKHKDFNKKLVEDGYIPKDGFILPKTEFAFNEGENGFDILEKALKQNKIQIEYEGVSENVFGSVYIEGISYLYEFDCGDNSGWVFEVNGEMPNCGISDYFPKNGDELTIYYTTNYNNR